MRRPPFRKHGGDGDPVTADFGGNPADRRQSGRHGESAVAGGAGVALLFGRFELSGGVRYYFGYSDLLRNRSKYYDNVTDNTAENPFWYTPQRSPMDNMMIRVGVAYRFAPEFRSWNVKPPKREKESREFNFGPVKK